MKNLIIKVEPDSIGQEAGIEVGDILLSINDKKIIDVFDYRYLINDEYIEVAIEKTNGEQWILEIEKYEDEDLGIVFESGLMDNAKSCTNKCIFCFIDQLPKGMRKTLYFKDDDSRLSFLQGNYVTLTNMKDEDFERILHYRLSPINVSVHTTDMELRHFMLKNPNSKKLFYFLDKIYETGLEMNFQVVLCKGINDGEHLEKTIMDLSKYIPNGYSMSVVPIGISDHRDGLFPVEAFEKEDCIKVVDQIEKLQKKFKKQYGTNFVYGSDEFYLVGEVPLPKYEEYESFPQIENGVGMIANFQYEIEENLTPYNGEKKTVSIITGVLAFDFINNISQRIMSMSPNLKIIVHKITNNFFGNKITVSGLITGNDIIEQLQGCELGDYILLPSNALRNGEEVFLDNITLSMLCEKLNTSILPVKDSGVDFLTKLYNKGE